MTSRGKESNAALNSPITCVKATAGTENEYGIKGMPLETVVTVEAVWSRKTIQSRDQTIGCQRTNTAYEQFLFLHLF